MAEPDGGIDPEEEELERDAAALIGRALGEFIIREPLSGGGFGLVFFAEQKGLAREAVIKVLRRALAADQTIVQRFLREARLATLLDHPYAAHTYGFGAEPDGLLWIAMELVRGTPLDTLLQLQGPIPLERFAPLLERICQVVETAHEHGIVHRDLKPANVMVLSRAGQLLPKLLDFGIARLVGEAEPDAGPAPPPGAALPDASLRLTGAHMAMGSPHYMAPEQWVDASAADSRADIYSLGVICYQALTGRVPFRAASRDQLAALHARAPVPPLGAGFPAALDQVLARAMAKRAPDRFASALELAAAFQSASGTGAQGAPLPRLDPPVRDAAIAGAPQPMARAIAALDSARNAHQARDALWQVARVAVRLVGGVALAAHRHVALASTDPALGEKLRLLRGRAPADETWLEVARSLVARFAGLRDAHPVPELVDFLLGDASKPLDELLALRASAEATAGGEERVRALFERGLPLAAAALRGLEFLVDYPLVVAGARADGAADTVVLRPDGSRAGAAGEVWMGGQAGARPQLPLAGPVASGHAALADQRGVVIVSLWPFVQAHEPSPGAGTALFFLDGRGRRGARLVALPDPFEVEDEEAWSLLGDMLDESSISRSDASAEESCPYPGLSAFTAADAAAFVGRERETEAFVNRLRVQSLLAVVGPSGAGKSSFVQAGVLPALPTGWTALVVRPGPSPLASLAARLTSAGIDAGSLRARLSEDPDALAGLLAGRADTLVLVIDQVEELFTVCDDPAERALYAAALARAARAADDPVRVVMTLRDDFLVRAEELPAWRSRLGRGIQILTTPDEPDLRRILTEPLRRIGYELDPELPDEMVREVAGEPAALALLSFTASRLWELRDRRFRQIGRKAYRSLGGVGGALAHHAEDTLSAMPSEEQRLVREVFRHAVTAEGTRAPLAPAELEAALGGGPHARAVIDKLVAARLLVVSDAELGERIEVAHEALLSAWPRVVTWRQEEAAGARLRDLLRTAARQWDERGRPSGLLWRGDALAEYRIWRGRHPAALTPTEEAFAGASLADAARARRVRRALVVGAFAVLAAGSVALVIFGARADRARGRAVDSERAAQRSADELELQLRSQYEGQGRRLVVADDPLKGLAFLAEAGKHGVRGPAHDFVVAEAIRAIEGELYSVRHDNMIGRVRFSPDGARLLTTGYDDRARLWNAADGAPLATLQHDAPVVRAAFSPDGARIATGTGQAGPGEAGLVALWSADGAPAQRLATRGAVQAIEFSPDGGRLLVVTASDEVTLWDPETGALVARLADAAEGAESPFGSPAAFSPDGRLIACGDRAGRVRLWDARTLRPLPALRGHQKRLQAVRFATSGARLVTASQDGSAIVWSTASWRPELTLRHGDQVTSASFSPDDRLVLTASADRTAILWDAATGQPLRTLAGHLAAVTQAAFSADGTRVATVSEDATAVVWDAATGERLARHLGHAGPIKDVAFSPDGTRMATASLDGSATVWSTAPTRRVMRWTGHDGPVPTADLAPDGTRAATGGTDGVLRVWDVATGRELLHLPAHGEVILDLRFSPRGDRIATASADHLVKVWSARDGALLATMKHEDWAKSVSWSPDGALLASAGEDGMVRIWSVGSGEPVRAIRAHDGAPVAAAAFSPDGMMLATTGDDRTTRLFDPASGRQLARFEHADVRFSLVFSPTGDQAVSLTSKNTASIWRVRDGAVVTQLVGHVGAIREVAWGRQGLIATASADRTARIWDPVTGEQLAVLTHPAEVMRPALDARGRYLLTTGVDGSAAIWEFPGWTGDQRALEKLVRCRVPFVIENERVAARPRDSSSCTRPAPAQ